MGEYGHHSTLKNMKDNFFIILVVGIVLLGSAVFLLVRFLGREMPPAQLGETGTTATNVQPSNNEPAVSGVRYTGNEFIPAHLTLSQNAEGEGCFLTIVNDSNEELLIRLGPHNSAGEDPGFPYDTISPRGSLVIDPRYRIEKISLHNHLNPEQEVIVELGQSCLL